MTQGRGKKLRRCGLKHSSLLTLEKREKYEFEKWSRWEVSTSRGQHSSFFDKGEEISFARLRRGQAKTIYTDVQKHPSLLIIRKWKKV